ncbi:DAK2 domain-containing protein [Dactylosporangium fulvum]|uniref:DAK2 domain-containing protein n=1 Tax=Dactylosporangium fulvum TaxID=53359 RepID=A0ABY5W5Y0_9ACTN|nr:DAK2 domain-containing protein [Dactylosporangium fulvum]UWP84103.1 DAK2 domain-containing protein [Dactylosporangium fulvum]
MPDSVDAAAVRRWCATGLVALRRHEDEINALNVYPVPDGDTGTNLVLTLAAAVDSLTAAAEDRALGAVLRTAARAALLGARGNSGIILAQLFKGLAESLADTETAGGPELARALDHAAKTAYLAVAAPVEGTVLSVGAAAARAANAAVLRVAAGEPVGAASGTGGDGSAGSAGSVGAAGDTVAAVARAAADGARAALARTPEQLPALARAGVVDAGGRGLVVLLDALVETLTGEAAPEFATRVPTITSRPAAAGRAPGAGRPTGEHRPAEMEREAGSDEFGYEVQYLLDAPAEAVDRLRDVLGRSGDSLVVIGDERTWHVHVHVNDVGAAIEAGIEAGRPSRITVTRFADQIAARQGLALIPQQRERAVVVVCTGAGLGELLTAEGATVLGGTPSTGEILEAIKATGAGRVVVLPNDPNVLATATAAAAEARAVGIRAGVVPTRSPVQALAAMAVRDHHRRFEDDVIAMAEAAARCRSAEVTIASREALTVAGRCQPGDVLAIVDGEVNLIGQDVCQTAVQLLDRMLTAGGELVTLIAGQGAPAELGETLRAHVEGAWPFVEVQCYEGGQPHYPLLVGVE